ncbi:14146_t:CDS:2, partial [Acaulospora morrowiae]
MSGEESSDETFLLLQVQEIVEKFFKKNTVWSLLSFLNFRAKTKYFTRDKRREHGLYKRALELLSVNNAQAREYLTGVIYDSIKDSKDARTFLSDKLKSFVKEHAGKRNHDHIEDSQGRKESYESNPGFHTPDPKKAKTDSTFNVSFDEYTIAVNAVNSIQNDKESAHTNPLWWGVLDFREENVSPSPSLPRAKNFLSANEIDHLMNMTQNAIQEENEKISKSAESFLEALLLSEIVSLQLLAKE